MTRLMGKTTRELGAMPMVHIIIAPIQTCIGIREILGQGKNCRGILAEPHRIATVSWL